MCLLNGISYCDHPNDDTVSSGRIVPPTVMNIPVPSEGEFAVS